MPIARGRAKPASETLQTLKIDDPAVQRAIAILVDALQRNKMRGVVEMRQALELLERLKLEPNEEAFEFAVRTFNSLDGSLREMVGKMATDAAKDHKKGLTPLNGSTAKPSQKKYDAGGWTEIEVPVADKPLGLR
ncbi:MAG: hypothetical protein GC191_13505 [Azospirillum sp.]|nr:hypothetical protein [Azospirillum sp.]